MHFDSLADFPDIPFHHSGRIPYNSHTQIMPTIAENEASGASRLLVALVTIDDAAYSNIAHALAQNFRIVQAGTENLIKGFVDDPELRAMIFDLDSIGEGAKDGVEVLQEIRALREDIVLVALSSSSRAGLSTML